MIRLIFVSSGESDSPVTENPGNPMLYLQRFPRYPGSPSWRFRPRPRSLNVGDINIDKPKILLTIKYVGIDNNGGGYTVCAW